MTKPYQLSIPTGVSKGGKDVLATIDKACGSGSGGSDVCFDWCRFCLSQTMRFTFGGVLSGIGPIDITGTDHGSYWTWDTPSEGISTPCGTLRIIFETFIGASGVSLNVSVPGGSLVRTSESPQCCTYSNPGDPDGFFFPSSVDGGNSFGISGNSGGCNGTATVTVTNAPSGGSGSGSRNPYDFAVDTLITKTGRRVLAAIDCSSSGGSSSGGGGNSVYWYGTDTGVRKNGKRVLTGYNPCCGSGPTITTPQPITGCCDLPPVLYVTFPASMSYLGTMTLALQTGQRCDNYAPGGATEPVGPAYAGTIASSACGKVWGCLNCIFRVSTSVSHYIFYFGYGDPPAFGSISSGGWECFLYSCDPVLIVAPVSGKNADCNAVFDYAHITETAP